MSNAPEEQEDLEYLKAAADMIWRQVEKADGEYMIPVDPDVADFMGCFQDKALDEVFGDD